MQAPPSLYAPSAQLKLAVTARCTNDCPICFNDTRRADNEGRIDLPLARLRELVREAASLGMAGVYFSGGEPLLRYRELVELSAEAQALGLPSSVVTNAGPLAASGAYASKNEALLRGAGTWGRGALELLEAWARAGLARVFLSVDNSHNTLAEVDASPANRVPTQVVARVLEALLELGFGRAHPREAIGHRLRVSATASGSWASGTQRMLEDLRARVGLELSEVPDSEQQPRWWTHPRGRVLVKRLQTAKVGAALVLPERLVERRRGAALEQIRCANMRPRAAGYEQGAHHQDLSINHDGEVTLCGNFMYPVGNVRSESLGSIIARVNEGNDRGSYGGTAAVLHRLLRLSQEHGHGERAIGEAFHMLRRSSPGLVEGLISEGGACTALGREPRVQEAFVRAYDARYGSCS